MKKYGIEHWTTTDRYGNPIECFANHSAEIHTKNPVCVCGGQMVETRSFEWDCPKCGKHLESDDYTRTLHADDYLDSNLEPDEDFGEFKYMEDDDGTRAFIGAAPGYEIDFFRLA